MNFSIVRIIGSTLNKVDEKNIEYVNSKEATLTQSFTRGFAQGVIEGIADAAFVAGLVLLVVATVGQTKEVITNIKR